MGAIAGRACPAAGGPLSRERSWTAIGRSALPETGYGPGPNDTMAHEWLGGPAAAGHALPPWTPHFTNMRASLMYVNKRVTMIIMEEQELNFERYSQ